MRILYDMKIPFLCSLMPLALFALSPFVEAQEELHAAASPSQPVTADHQIRVATELINRVLPGYSGQFTLEIIPRDQDRDVFEIDTRDGKIVLRGNNPVSLAMAFNQYIKYTAKGHFSWFGDQLNLPQTLPLPDKKERKVIDQKFRAYLNYCTVSYSAAWWDWKRWERELDFMAMNGINMPLSPVGLEAVWYNTLLKFKFSDEEARRFLSGPGHFAWQWMQNLQGVGGPLPKSWIDSHITLGKQIMERQLELGMQPIQQGFTGLVPRELKDKYPEAKISLQGRWCGFPGAAQLDPLDPLFAQIGRTFLEEQKKLFGAHGVYAADPFHESSPPVHTPEYLPAVGKAIHELFQSFHPGSVWAMQCWSMYKPIVDAVPVNNLIMLDLNGSKRKQHQNFWGHPFIAGNLHNFGGRINMHGDLPLIASNQYAQARKEAPNACGSGLFMEGIEQNPVYYDLTFEMPLHEDAVDLKTWLKDYAERRYGTKSPAAEEAWMLLLEGPYRKGTNGTENSSIIAARPALKPKKSGPNAGFHIPYPTELLYRAQENLLKDADKMKNSKPYLFDIVDVQRQIQSNLGQAIHAKAAEAFKNKDKAEFVKHSTRFLELLSDTDVLLRTRREFNFDRWLTEATAWGTTPQEKELLERDATSLVTSWGEGTAGDPIIFDYSWREWSGLIEGFYRHRWQMFYDMLRKHLDDGTDYNEDKLPMVHGREAWRANDFYKELAQWEENFVKTPGKARTPVIQGDEFETVRRLFGKYKELAKEYGNVPLPNTDKGPRNENLGEAKVS